MFPKTAAPMGSRPTDTPPIDLRTLRDDELLARFFQQQQDAAFSALVERYGPMVYNVCRRILGDSPDAEDAFQATFLVLVRKGSGLRDPGRLANWLYGVAYRSARKVRTQRALHARSQRWASIPSSSSEVRDMTYEELHAILDEEISQLPEKYALPLVLCYLEGKTNAQAAAALGWPEGSMSRRLSRARELLRGRLARRGLALSAALLAASLARPAVASVPGELMASTVRAGSLVARGTAVAEVVSPATAHIVEEVLLGMSVFSRVSIPAAVVLGVLLTAGTAGMWHWGAAAQAASRWPVSLQRPSSVHAMTRDEVDPPGTPQHASASTGQASTGCASACSAP
jgi:RNA polymerase sigma factor (sigma-70 family)